MAFFLKHFKSSIFSFCRKKLQTTRVSSQIKTNKSFWTKGALSRDSGSLINSRVNRLKVLQLLGNTIWQFVKKDWFLFIHIYKYRLHTVTPATQMHDRSSASFEEKRSGFGLRDYIVWILFYLQLKNAFSFVTSNTGEEGCICQVPLTARIAACPLGLERGLSAFDKWAKRQWCKDSVWKEMKEKSFAKVGFCFW